MFKGNKLQEALLSALPIKVRCVVDHQRDHLYSSAEQTDQDILFCDIATAKVEKRHKRELIMAMFPHDDAAIDLDKVICSVAVRQLDLKNGMIKSSFSHIQVHTPVPIACCVIFMNQYKHSQSPMALADRDNIPVYIFVKDTHKEPIAGTSLLKDVSDRLYLIGRLTIKEIKSPRFKAITLGECATNEFNNDPLLKTGEKFYSVSRQDIVAIRHPELAVEFGDSNNSRSQGISAPGGPIDDEDEEQEKEKEKEEIEKPMSFAGVVAAWKKRKAVELEQQQDRIRTTQEEKVIPKIRLHSSVYLFDPVPPNKTEATQLLVQYNIKDLVMKRLDLFLGQGKDYRNLIASLSSQPRQQTLIDSVTFHFLAKVSAILKKVPVVNFLDNIVYHYERYYQNAQGGQAQYNNNPSSLLLSQQQSSLYNSSIQSISFDPTPRKDQTHSCQC